MGSHWVPLGGGYWGWLLGVVTGGWLLGGCGSHQKSTAHWIATSSSDLICFRSSGSALDGQPLGATAGGGLRHIGTLAAAYGG
jgi:hypothetical protein